MKIIRRFTVHLRVGVIGGVKYLMIKSLMNDDDEKLLFFIQQKCLFQYTVFAQINAHPEISAHQK